jgi:hypothetical protein
MNQYYINPVMDSNHYSNNNSDNNFEQDFNTLSVLDRSITETDDGYLLLSYLNKSIKHEKNIDLKNIEINKYLIYQLFEN